MYHGKLKLCKSSKIIKCLCEDMQGLQFRFLKKGGNDASCGCDKLMQYVRLSDCQSVHAMGVLAPGSAHA